MNCSIVRKITLSAAVLLLLSAAGLVVAQNTTRRNLRPGVRAEKVAGQHFDSGSLAAVTGERLDGVSLKGYDKPLRSRRETFFVINNITPADTIRGISLTVTYLDTSGRMLHKQSRTLPCVIPPAETRQLGMKSWDVQNNFYYVNSTVPARAAQATPYSVTMTVDTVFVSPKNR